MSRTVTFLSVVVAWVFFRAESLGSGWNMVYSMGGFNGISLPKRWVAYAETSEHMLNQIGISFEGMFNNTINLDWGPGLIFIAFCALLSWFGPNTQQILARYKPANIPTSKSWDFEGKSWVTWKPTPSWAVATGVMAIASLLSLSRVSEFLYFQF